jgi:hypothetical protein
MAAPPARCRRPAAARRSSFGRAGSAGSGSLASQAETAATSARLRRLAIVPMQSGAWARRAAVAPGAELGVDVVARQAEQAGDGRQRAGQAFAVAGDAGRHLQGGVAARDQLASAFEFGRGQAAARRHGRHAGAGSRNNRRSRAGSRRTGGRPSRSSADTGAGRRGSSSAGCTGSRPACRRCAEVAALAAARRWRRLRCAAVAGRAGGHALGDGVGNGRGAWADAAAATKQLKKRRARRMDP